MSKNKEKVGAAILASEDPSGYGIQGRLLRRRGLLSRTMKEKGKG